MPPRQNAPDSLVLGAFWPDTGYVGVLFYTLYWGSTVFGTFKWGCEDPGFPLPIGPSHIL